MVDRVTIILVEVLIAKEVFCGLSHRYERSNSLVNTVVLSVALRVSSGREKDIQEPNKP